MRGCVEGVLRSEGVLRVRGCVECVRRLRGRVEGVRGFVEEEIISRCMY